MSGVLVGDHTMRLEETIPGRVRPVCPCGYRGISSNVPGKAMADGNQHLRRVGAPVMSTDKPWTRAGTGKL